MTKKSTKKTKPVDLSKSFDLGCGATLKLEYKNKSFTRIEGMGVPYESRDEGSPSTSLSVLMLTGTLPKIIKFLQAVQKQKGSTYGKA